MTSLFKTPNIPAPAPVQAPPAETDQAVEEEVLKQRAAQRRRQGAAATILTGQSGVTQEAAVSRKTLLGQ